MATGSIVTPKWYYTVLHTVAPNPSRTTLRLYMYCSYSSVIVATRRRSGHLYIHCTLSENTCHRIRARCPDLHGHRGQLANVYLELFLAGCSLGMRVQRQITAFQGMWQLNPELSKHSDEVGEGVRGHGQHLVLQISVPSIPCEHSVRQAGYSLSTDGIVCKNVRVESHLRSSSDAHNTRAIHATRNTAGSAFPPVS